MLFFKVPEKPDQRLRAKRSSRWSRRRMEFMVSTKAYSQPAALLIRPRLSTPLHQTPTYKYTNEQRKVLDSVKPLLPYASISAFDEWKNNRLVDHVRLVKLTYMDKEEANALVEVLPIIPPPIQVTS
jgi:hypothetical protein